MNDFGYLDLGIDFSKVKNIMTLLESAKMNGLNPFMYLEHVLNTLKYYKEEQITHKVL